jgi:hypothetical protein
MAVIVLDMSYFILQPRVRNLTAWSWKTENNHSWNNEPINRSVETVESHDLSVGNVVYKLNNFHTFPVTKCQTDEICDFNSKTLAVNVISTTTD